MPDCRTCAKNKDHVVSYYTHKSVVDKLNRTIKRLWIVIIVLALLLVCSSVHWVACSNSPPVPAYTQQ